MVSNNKVDKESPIESNSTAEDSSKPIESNPTDQTPPQTSTSSSQTNISSHMAMSIISIFFFWPLSIPAIINASKVKTLIDQNDFDGAKLASKKAKIWSLWSYGVGVVLSIVWILLISVVAFTGLSYRTAALKVSDNEMSYISEGNSDAAYDLTSSEFRAVTSKTDFDTFVSTYKSLPLKTAEVISENVDNNSSPMSTADFKYSLTQDGQKYFVTIDLVELNGEWNVQNIYIDTDSTQSGTNSIDN
jgi:hypothetical protein